MTVRRLCYMILSPFLLTATSGVNAQVSANTPGHGFEVERYAVALRPDMATTAVSVTETVVLRSLANRLSRLAFTANALQIGEATMNGQPVRMTSDERAIVFNLPRSLRKGERATLHFQMTGTPARGVTAAAGGIYAGYFACEWMVCVQDAPGDKAHLQLDLFLPPGLESVGVGRGRTSVVVPGELVRHHWRSTRPYSSYLHAFAAGPFARSSVSTVQGRLIYLDGTGIGADLPARFAESPALAAFFADKAGMPLPDGRYVQLLVPGREAQEAASFSLIGKMELDDERGDPSSAWVIAHEMAHQWWGNLVTCATWRDFWLNEGIATFMVAAWKEHRLGTGAYHTELDVARGRVDWVRQIGFDKPLAWEGQYPSLRARRAIQYSKGALFLAHLRKVVGDVAFWRGLRRFTRRNAGKSVTSRDFQNAMQRASGRDLSTTFAEWVYGT